jgi:hypothetical protein
MKLNVIIVVNIANNEKELMILTNGYFNCIFFII